MICVTACAILNSVQDLGRTGHYSLGVGSAGAMDKLAMRTANILIGNAESDAVLELQTFPFEFRCEADMLVGVAGADVRLLLDGRPYPGNWRLSVRKGQAVRLEGPLRGARCYVALSGGILVDPVLGSRSTALRSGFGGHNGRALRVGDTLIAGAIGVFDGLSFGVKNPVEILQPGESPVAGGERRVAIRAIAGPDFDAFTPEARSALSTSAWKVTSQSDRQGYRFAGPHLELTMPMELRSYGLIPGLIQVPPGGQPIVQLADANTMGGYPRIASVIEADLWRLAQARPGTSIHFRLVELEEGVAAQAEVDQLLGRLAERCALHRLRAR